METKPLISVIVPAYNSEKWIARCLDSIKAQTYENLEIIVVDDGSTDGTGRIADGYAETDRRIKVIAQPHSGVARARLNGVSKSKGEWVGFVDSDDTIKEKMYDTLIDNALTYNADISHMGYQMIFPDGRISYFHNTGELIEHSRDTALIEILSGEKIEPSLCNKLFSRLLFNKLLMEEIVDCNIRINEDLLLNYYLFSYSVKSVYNDLCLYEYIVNNESVTRSCINNSRIYDPIRVKDIIRRDIDSNLIEYANKAYINTCINVFNSLIISSGKGNKDIEFILELIKKEKQNFSLLSFGRRWGMRLVLFAPNAYKVLYSFYSCFLQRSPYR